MRFWKMHGIGNDYIVMDNRQKPVESPGAIAKKLCKRKFGIGADGILLVYNSKIADVRMRIFNPDGSEAEMCGNGVRCFVKFCFEKQIVPYTHMKVETLSGIKETWLKTVKSEVSLVKVRMGAPLFERERIPMVGSGTFINQPFDVNGKKIKATALSIGNPHCVIFVEDLDKLQVNCLGPKIEKHPLFPNRTNVEFVQTVSREELRVRTWERGVGETLACGTGACASVVAATTLKKIDGEATVRLLGGELKIEYTKKNILMSGRAEKVFEGVIDDESNV
jgi:diaminopimelate epimerase